MAVRGGRYELLRAIASGGMAQVHLGRALGAGGFERLVAIKVMHAHLAEEPEFVAMFLDEARLAARIRHPNVVGTIDIQQDEQGLFLVMDYVEGPSLQRVLRAFTKKQRAALPLDVALRIFLDTLAGLHAAHELRGTNGEPLHLVHRDVSPQNVLIGVDGVAQLTDFGVARAESRLQTTRGSVVKGKVCYMAPEQIRAEPIDRRTDIYAAGALLWELLTGQRLIRGDNEGAMMEKILRGHHPAPREMNPVVPEAIEAVAMRALSSAPDDRYPTAAAFAEALEAAAVREGITIATPRVLSAFIRDLVGTDDPALAATSLSTSRALDPAAPASGTAPSRDHVVSAATAVPSSNHPPISTHATMAAPSADTAPRRASPLRWVGAGAVVLLVGGGWLLVTKGPLRLSWGDAPTPSPTITAATAAGASSASAPRQAPAAPAEPAPSATATNPAPTISAQPAAPSATASVARPVTPGPAPKTARPKPEASPTAFRPNDL